MNEQKAYFSLRFKALFFDVIILGMAILFTLLMLLSGFLIETDFLFYALIFGIPLALISLVEVYLKTSIGKKISGLSLEIDAPFPFLALCVRNLIKFFSVFSFMFLALMLLNWEHFLQNINDPYNMTALVGSAALIISAVQIHYNKYPLHDLIARAKIFPVEGFKSRLLPYFLILVLAGILVAIALPNFIGTSCGGRSKVSSVKANMHTMQTMIETYAVDWEGVYPSSVEELYPEANQEKSPYWRDFTNPYLGYTGLGKSYVNEGQKVEPGIVTFESVGHHSLKYYIYGYDKSGNRIQQKGQDFYLTNS